MLHTAFKKIPQIRCKPRNSVRCLTCYCRSEQTTPAFCTRGENQAYLRGRRAATRSSKLNLKNDVKNKRVQNAGTKKCIWNEMKELCENSKKVRKNTFPTTFLYRVPGSRAGQSLLISADFWQKVRYTLVGSPSIIHHTTHSQMFDCKADVLAARTTCAAHTERDYFYLCGWQRSHALFLR